jgi:hypothetical protein
MMPARLSRSPASVASVPLSASSCVLLNRQFVCGQTGKV